MGGNERIFCFPALLVSGGPWPRTGRGRPPAWVRYLEGRIRLAPEDALLRAALSRAYLRAERFAEAARLARKEELGEILRAAEEAERKNHARRSEALEVADLAEAAGIPIPSGLRRLRAQARLEAGETSPAFVLLTESSRDEALLAKALAAFARTNAPPAEVLRLFRLYRGPLSPAAWEARAFAAWKTGDRVLALSGADSPTAREFLGRVLAADPVDREAFSARPARGRRVGPSGLSSRPRPRSGVAWNPTAPSRRRFPGPPLSTLSEIPRRPSWWP